jgi:hypothetical protein
MSDVPLIYLPGVIPDADEAFRSLLEGLPWERHTYKFKGRSGPVPRLNKADRKVLIEGFWRGYIEGYEVADEHDKQWLLKLKIPNERKQ